MRRVARLRSEAIRLTTLAWCIGGKFCFLKASYHGVILDHKSTCRIFLGLDQLSKLHMAVVRVRVVKPLGGRWKGCLK